MRDYSPRTAKGPRVDRVPDFNALISHLHGILAALYLSLIVNA